MYKKLYTILIAIGMTIASTQLFANGYTGMGHVNLLQNAYGTNWIFSSDGANDNPDNCSKNMMMLESTHPMFNQVYGLLLTAYITKKPVNVSVF